MKINAISSEDLTNGNVSPVSRRYIPLTGRITIILILVSLLSIGAGMFVVIINDIANFKQNFSDRIKLVAQTTGSYAAVEIEFNDKTSAQNSLAKLTHFPSINSASLYDKGGNFFLSYNSNSFNEPDLDIGNIPFEKFTEDTLTIIEPIELNNKHYGFIQMTASTHELRGTINKRIEILLALSIIIAIIAYIFAHRISQKLTAPILRLASQAREISEKKNYDVRVHAPRNDEIGILYNAFNEMLERIALEQGNLSDALAELKTSEARFSAMFNAIPDSVMFADTERKIRLNNPAVQKMFLYSDDELIGNTTEMLYPSHEDFIKQGKIRFNRGARGTDLPYEVEYKKKDGSCFWTESLRARVVTDTNEHIGFVGIFRDITDRKIHETELLNKQREQEQILDSMLDAVITITEKGEILSFNNGAIKMFGYQHEEILGKNIGSLMPKGLSDRHDYYLANFKDTGEARAIGVSRELKGIRKSGEEFPIRVSVAQLPDNPDGTRRYIGTVQDISREKKQTEMLQRSQKMDALGKLTGGIAHDFKNMLQVVIGYSHILEHMLGDDQEKVSLVREIANAGDRANKLTKKLLSFSSANQVDARIIDINEHLNEIKLMLEKTLTAKIDIQYDLEDVIWPANLDENGLVDMILNLSINAMHAMPNGGELTIQTRNITLEEYELNTLNYDHTDCVQLKIVDTGTGMPEEVKEKIFEPFFSTKGGKGTGLGLCQVYGYVKQSHGTIQVESQLGHGTTIIILFPKSVDEIENQDVQKAALKHDVEGDKTILVVDDEPALTRLAEAILTNKNYTVCIAHNGEEALEILQKENIDILLSDVIMPGMDGFQLAEKVSTLYPHIKIQLTSGYNDGAQLSTFNKKLQQNSLQKPYDSEQLISCITKLVGEDNANDIK